MARSGKNDWDQLLLSLGSIAIFGAIFCVGGYAVGVSFWQGFLTNIGTALIIAAALGFTVDKYFKLRLLRDAFEAVFGYVLPEYFREELNRIAKEVFIALRVDMVLEIEKVGNDLVEVTWSIARELKNITDRTETFRLGIGADDFGFDGRASEILNCEIAIDEKPRCVHSVIANGPHSNDGREGKIESTWEEHKIPSHKKFSVYQKVKEFHRINEMTYWFFSLRRPIRR